MKHAEPFAYTNLVLITNSASTNSDRAKKLAQELRHFHSWASVSVVEVTGFNQTKTYQVVESAARKFTKDTLVGVGGGDGTVSSVVHVLSTSSVLTSNNLEATLLPLWGGNANDLAVMLNGLINTTSLKKVLQAGKPVAVHPLQLEITPKHSQPTVRTAICYASFGASAHILEQMERSSHKRDNSRLKLAPVRMAAEVRDIAKAVFNIHPVSIQTRSRKVAIMYDRIFINGSRYAKIMHTPVSLPENRYFEIATSRKDYRYILELFRSLFGRGDGKISDQNKVFLVKNQTLAQIDGEVIGIDADTLVSIGLHPRKINFLSKKLRNPNE